jgi:glycosyltransferase involved in cell wall biosynthesis
MYLYEPAAMELSVVFPAFNEEANIDVTIPKAVASLRKRFASFEVIIVDDCSRDATLEKAKALAERFPEVRVVRNERNLGSGGSVMHGWAEAKGELVTHNAMDYPFDLESLDIVLPLMKDADVVVAARRERAGYTAYRKLTSIVHRSLLHALFDLRLRDYNFVQVYRREVIEKARPKTRSAAFLTPEILIRAHDLGYRIREVEVEYLPRERGVATSGKPKVILTSLRDMLGFWARRAVERRLS